MATCCLGHRYIDTCIPTCINAYTQHHIQACMHAGIKIHTHARTGMKYIYAYMFVYIYIHAYTLCCFLLHLRFNYKCTCGHAPYIPLNTFAFAWPAPSKALPEPGRVVHLRLQQPHLCSKEITRIQARTFGPLDADVDIDTEIDLKTVQDMNLWELA